MTTCIEAPIVVAPAPAAFRPCEFRVSWAATEFQRRGAYALRRAVFCAEQAIFLGDDRDALDEHAQLLVAQSCVAGMPDEIVGTVRIHAHDQGVWWGSRLAVHPAFRQHGRIGATLIRLAVSSAHAQGATQFFAHVQMQNVPLFEKLRWTSLGEERLHGRPHMRMQADLAAYPPCHDPWGGFVTCTQA